MSRRSKRGGGGAKGHSKHIVDMEPLFVYIITLLYGSFRISTKKKNAESAIVQFLELGHLQGKRGYSERCHGQKFIRHYWEQGGVPEQFSL